MDARSVSLLVSSILVEGRSPRYRVSQTKAHFLTRSWIETIGVSVSRPSCRS